MHGFKITKKESAVKMRTTTSTTITWYACIYNAMHRSWVELLAVVNHSEAGEKTTTAF